MALSTRTDLGEIRISDHVVAGIITDIMEEPDFYGKVWPATERGREFGRGPRIADSDFEIDIQTSADDLKSITIEFSVIVKFGISIKTTTHSLADHITDNMLYILGTRPSVIIINIAGAKSKHIARRNTRTIYKYTNSEQE